MHFQQTVKRYIWIFINIAVPALKAFVQVKFPALITGAGRNYQSDNEKTG
jgi:hypothetical protein